MNLTSFLFQFYDDDVFALAGSGVVIPAGPDISQSILDKILKDTDFSVAPVWISLHSGPTGLDGASEISGGSYARVQAGSSYWSAASGGSIVNTLAVTFGGMPVVTASWAGIWSAETGGTFIRGVSLNYPVPLRSGDTPRFPAGSLTVRMSSDFSSYLANKVLDYLFRSVAFVTAPAYWALHTGPKDDAGGDEVVGGSYARQVATILDWESTGSSILGDTVFSLDYQALVSFSGMPSVAVKRLALWDAVSTGHFLMWGREDVLAVAPGETVSIDGTVPGNLSATLTQLP